MAPGLRVLIIGGGVGGLTTAYALRRAGIDATVYEKAGEMQKIQVGGGIALWSNAFQVLQRLDLAERMLAVGGPVRYFECRTWRGDLPAIWPLRVLERKLGAPTVGVARSDLHRVLVGALDEGALEMGAECAGFEQDATGVTLRFADGREERGDVLIGADGISSAVRAQLVPEAQPRYVGYMLWQANIVLEHPRLPHDVFRMLWGPGERFVFFPVGQGRTYWAAISNAPEGEADPESGLKARLLERYRHYPEPTQALIEATPEAKLARMDVYDLKPVRRWGEGRVTLLGDAAHAMTFNIGQGAGQAIEDAAVLTGLLAAATREDVPAALREYERRRMARAAFFANVAYQLGALGTWENRVACALRGRLFPLFINRHSLKYVYSRALDFRA